MTEEYPESIDFEPAKPAPEPEPTSELEPEEELNEVTLRSFPKTVLFYPTMFFSLTIAIAMLFVYLNPLLWPIADQLFYGLTFAWFVFFIFNFLVVSFEFSKGVVVGLILLIVIAIMGIGFITTLTGVIPWINPAILGLFININSMVAFSLTFGFVILLAWITTRFYYFRITPNEIIYKKGLLGDVERFGTTNIVVHKEIRDIFEFIFLRSGRLTIMIPGRKQAIVIDNVPKINSMEKKILFLLRRIEIDID
jgi:hypothetical protein